jgi:hypothetical protein
MEEEAYSNYSGSCCPSPSKSGTQYAKRACNSATWVHEEVIEMESELDKHIAYFNRIMKEMVPAISSLSTEARINMMQNKAAVQRVSAMDKT